MLYLHYFNATHLKASESGYHSLFLFLIIELVIYCIDILNMTVFIWVLFTAAQFHFNFNLILGIQYIIHLYDNFIMISMKVYLLLGYQNDDDPLSDNFFFWTMKCSICLFVAAMCALPFIILERFFATYYLADYETNQRRHIAYILVVTLFVIGIIGGFVLQNKENTVYLVGFLIFLNVSAVVSNFVLRYWNKQKEKEFRKNIHKPNNKLAHYSVAMRFQVLENLKSFNLLNGIVIYMGLLNSVLVTCVLITSYDISPGSQTLCTSIFEIAIFVYSFMHPQIMRLHCPKWKVQLRHLIAKVCCWRRRRQTAVSPLQGSVATETRGNEMMEKYFAQLIASWNQV